MSKHFKFLLLSVALFVFGYLSGRQHSLTIMDHFTKAVFFLIGVRVALSFELGFLRLPILAFMAGCSGAFLGALTLSPLFSSYGFVFFLLGISPFFFLSTLAVNEFRPLWNRPIIWRSILSTVVGYGFVVLFNIFLHLKVPRLSSIEVIVSGSAAFMVCYGTFYLYRRDAEKLNANLALSFFLGVPILRFISSLKNPDFKKYGNSLFKSLYVPLLIPSILVAKYHQYGCRLYQKIGWGSVPVPEEAGKCDLGIETLEKNELLLCYLLFVVFLFFSFLVLNRLKKKSLAQNGKVALLVTMSLSSLLILTESTNFALTAAVLPLTALGVDE